MKWSYCTTCNGWTTLCDKCGNNACNAYHKCDKCVDAYNKLIAHIKNIYDVNNKKAREYIESIGDEVKYDYYPKEEK